MNKLSDFDFHLPEELIAHNPVSPRDTSKMLVYNTQTDEILDLHFYDLPTLLTENDVIVVNRSKVRNARIIFSVDGASKEIFVLKKLSGDNYQCMVRPGKYFSLGRSGEIEGLSYKVVGVLQDGTRKIEFSSKTDEDVEDVLSSLGDLPLPPYIKNSSANDEQYQTVYADNLGSVAAPTAGLHFTKKVFEELKRKNIDVEKVTLHVGRGTFLPVKTENLDEHVMHSESFELDHDTAQRLNSDLKKMKNILAIGTTSVRTLESNFVDGKFNFGKGDTEIFIKPGYDWKVVNKLLTNFHLPKSTLLMLVASFLESKGVENGVDKLHEIYQHAIDRSYRFYSFGDCCLFI